MDSNAVGVDPCSAKWDWNKYLPEKSTVDSTFDFFATQKSLQGAVDGASLCQVLGGVKVYNNKSASSCSSAELSNLSGKLAPRTNT